MITTKFCSYVVFREHYVSEIYKMDAEIQVDFMSLFDRCLCLMLMPGVCDEIDSKFV